MMLNQDDPQYATKVFDAITPTLSGAFTAGAINGASIDTYDIVDMIGFRVAIETLEALKVVALKVQSSLDNGSGVSDGSWVDVPAAAYMAGDITNPANWGVAPADIAAAGVTTFYVSRLRGATLKRHFRLVATPDGTGFISAQCIFKAPRLPWPN